MLQHVAQGLQEAMRPDDFVARSGGEEFVIVYSDKSSRDALAVTEHIRQSIQAAPFVSEAVNVPVTVSISLTELEMQPMSFEDILRRADKALYLAKSQGRNRLEVAS